VVEIDVAPVAERITKSTGEPRIAVPFAERTAESPSFFVTVSGELLARAPSLSRAPYAAPVGHVEQVLAELWRELLDVEAIGRDDDFFALGGHSLLVVRMTARLRTLLGVEVLVNGEKVGQAAEKKPDKWWEAGSLSDQSDKFPLLNKNETPFAMLWWDRYAEIQKER